MKQSELKLPGYHVGEYMILLQPGNDLEEKVVALKDEFNKTFDVEGRPSKPNLMLSAFTQYEMMESRIFNKLNLIAKTQYPFKVELKDFGSFPSHTIYIGVTSKVPIQDLVKKIRTEAQNLMKFEDKKPYFHMEPHITIAKKLKPWQFEKGWLEYSQKHFTGRFIASELILLKRYEGEATWKLANRFIFENLPVETKQGQLF